MGRKASRRSGSKQKKSPGIDEIEPIISGGFGLSNLTASVPNLDDDGRDSGRNAGKGKKPQKKETRRKIKKSKKNIKSILKSSKKVSNPVEPSRSMLLLLGGESAKKAQVSGIRTRSGKSSATKKKKKLNEKVKKVKQKKNTPVLGVKSGGRRKRRKESHTVEKLEEIERQAELRRKRRGAKNKEEKKTKSPKKVKKKKEKKKEPVKKRGRKKKGGGKKKVVKEIEEEEPEEEEPEEHEEEEEEPEEGMVEEEEEEEEGMVVEEEEAEEDSVDSEISAPVSPSPEPQEEKKKPHRSRSRSKEKKVYNLFSRMSKKGRPKKTFEEKILKATENSKPVIIQQKLDVPWDQITEMNELLKKNLEKQEQMVKTEAKHTEKESISVAILKAIHNIGTKGLYKKIIKWAQDNYRDDIVKQIKTELGVKTRKKREIKPQKSKEEIRKIQEMEEERRLHLVIEEAIAGYDDDEQNNKKADEESVGSEKKTNPFKFDFTSPNIMGLNVTELVTAEKDDSAKASPVKEAPQQSYEDRMIEDTESGKKMTEEIEEDGEEEQEGEVNDVVAEEKDDDEIVGNKLFADDADIQFPGENEEEDVQQEEDNEDDDSVEKEMDIFANENDIVVTREAEKELANKVVQETPVVEETTAVEETPVVEETTAVEETTVVKETIVVETNIETVHVTNEIQNQTTEQIIPTETEIQINTQIIEEQPETQEKEHHEEPEQAEQTMEEEQPVHETTPDQEIPNEQPEETNQEEVEVTGEMEPETLVNPFAEVQGMIQEEPQPEEETGCGMEVEVTPEENKQAQEFVPLFSGNDTQGMVIDNLDDHFDTMLEEKASIVKESEEKINKETEILRTEIPERIVEENMLMDDNSPPTPEDNPLKMKCLDKLSNRSLASETEPNFELIEETVNKESASNIAVINEEETNTLVESGTDPTPKQTTFEEPHITTTHSVNTQEMRHEDGGESKAQSVKVANLGFEQIESKKIGLSDHGIQLEPLDVGTFGDENEENESENFFSEKKKVNEEGKNEKDTQVEKGENQQEGEPEKEEVTQQEKLLKDLISSDKKEDKNVEEGNQEFNIGEKDEAQNDGNNQFSSAFNFY